MPGRWEGSNRRAELPANWEPEIRPAILLRDGHACQWRTDTGICGEHANQVDHIRDRHDHSPSNLRALCEWHHNRKSSAEGNAARTRASMTRPAEKHPGLR